MRIARGTRGGRPSRSRKIGGGGGGGAPYEPPASGLQLWLDADDAATLTTSGSEVGTWTDKSSNGYVFTTITGTPFTGTRTIGGKNVIDFNDASYMRLTSGLLVGTDDWTVVVVAELDDANYNMLIGKTTASAADNRWFMLRDNIGPGFEYSFDTGGPAANPSVTSTAVTASGVPYIVMGEADRGTALNMYVNSPTLNATAGLNAGSSFAVDYSVQIGEYPGVSSYRLNGGIGEIFIWNRILTTGEREDLFDYLAGKFGITLT